MLIEQLYAFSQTRVWYTKLVILMGDSSKIAIISSLTGGLGHYCAHLAQPLSQYYNLKFITYPQVDLTGISVKQITDSFVKHYIKWPRFDIEEDNPLSIVSINEYLNERQYPLINIHVATTVKKKIEYFTTFILYAKRTNKTKFVFTLHDVLPYDEDKKIIPLLQMFYELADHFIVGNEDEKERLITNFQVAERKITVIHHGIYDLFNKHHYTKDSAKEYLDIPSDKKILLFFGWLRPYKGFRYLVEAVDILAQKRNDFLVYVASGLRYSEKKDFQEYEKTMQSKGLEKLFLTNWNYLNSTDIEAVFKASDIIVLPYIYASQSGVLMMANGFKKPVITTNVVYDKVWLDNKAGFVAKPKDASSLAEKIERLLDNPSLAQQFGEYGFEYAKHYFSWEEVAKNYAQVFKKILS